MKYSLQWYLAMGNIAVGIIGYIATKCNFGL